MARRVLITIVFIELQLIAKKYYMSQLSKKICFYVDIVFLELFQFTTGTLSGHPVCLII